MRASKLTARSVLSPAYNAAHDRHRELTRRQAEIAQLLSQGLRHKEIAARLSLTVGTIKYYTVQARHRLGCATEAELATKWRCLVCPQQNGAHAMTDRERAASEDHCSAGLSLPLSPGDRAEFAAHLVGCENCREQLRMCDIFLARRIALARESATYASSSLLPPPPSPLPKRQY